MLLFPNDATFWGDVFFSQNVTMKNLFELNLRLNSTRVSMEVSNYLVSWFITYLWDVSNLLF